MKPALLVSSILVLFSFSSYPDLQKTQEAVCRGKPVSVSQFDPKRPGPRTPFANGGGISEPFRLVIRERAEFNKFWESLGGLGSDKPPLPEVDFSREMIVVAAMGTRPSGYAIFIEGACEVDNQVEVLVRSANYLKCGMQLGIMTAPIDIVRLPKTDLPVVFRETEVTSDCKEFLR